MSKKYRNYVIKIVKVRENIDIIKFPLPPGYGKYLARIPIKYIIYITSAIMVLSGIILIWWAY